MELRRVSVDEDMIDDMSGDGRPRQAQSGAEKQQEEQADVAGNAFFEMGEEKGQLLCLEVDLGFGPSLGPGIFPEKAKEFFQFSHDFRCSFSSPVDFIAIVFSGSF